MKILLLVSLLSLGGCTRAEPECTLETRLVPGVPGSPGHLIPSPLQEHGASELATLMRTMKADLEAAREAIARGEPLPALHPKHRKIRCAWPTALEDRNPAFEASAIPYLQLVRTLDSRPADLRGAYEGVVAGCLACHANSCPGPIPAIEKLHLLPR